MVHSDNGLKFTSRRMLAWSEHWKVRLIHLQLGRPMQNGPVEGSHGRLREECSNVCWFRTLKDVPVYSARLGSGVQLRATQQFAGPPHAYGVQTRPRSKPGNGPA